MKIILLLFLASSMSYAQTVYKSLASEYYYLNYEGQSKIEWIERDIIVSDENIFIKSLGREAIDIQKWTIQNKKNIKLDNKTLEVINVYLSSGLENEYPATFTIIHPGNDSVELITCEIHPDSRMKLADGSPITVRFLID